jgi:L-aminopeptidase/D-esterase-like protein
MLDLVPTGPHQHTGIHNDLTDIAGLRVGHTTLIEPGWLTGCTVVLPDRSAVCGVSVRGGGPGTRETDLLDPRNLVDRVDAVVLSGGSAFGLGVADGVMRHLYAAGRGWPMGGPGEVVPIVPAAILFDLGRGGSWTSYPSPTDGEAACGAAEPGPVAQGTVGAGTGARAGGLKGGIGSASVVLSSGTTMAALVACNAVGSPMDLRTGGLLGARLGVDDEFADLPAVDPSRLAVFLSARAQEVAALRAGQATTIGVVATDATLTKAECAQLADVAHDGIARAVNPVHTAYDGDTLFALATGDRPAPMGPLDIVELQTAAADCVSRAIAHALLAATSTAGLTSWRDALT